MEKTKYTYYFGGELFNSKHLQGNATLAELIYDLSNGKYIAVLPQNLEQRNTPPHSIRDQDIITLLECDLGLFNYDSTEIDTGTVVEYMIAKFCDKPSVILRTDFRASGDQQENKWNLMSSFYPRTATVYVDSMTSYKNSELPKDPEQILKEKLSSQSAHESLSYVASEVIKAFDKVVQSEPSLKPEEIPFLYNWMSRMPGFNNEDLIKRTLDLKDRPQI
jgi:nucleoside 2-deoxyribosyltransferase